ncbi:MAG: radical SAM protein [Pseudomonadota bacterium]
MPLDLLLSVPIPSLVTRDPVLIPDLGLGYLAAATRRAGFSVGVIDWNPKPTEAVYHAQVARLAPRVAGVKAFTVNMRAVVRTLEVLREALPEAILLAGGPHPTVAEPAHLFDELPHLDLALRGEAEGALPKLMALLRGIGWRRDRLPELSEAFAGIPGLVWRDQAGVHANDTVFEDIRAVGLPAWDLIDPAHSAHFAIDAEAHAQNPHPAPLLATRGCPFACTFCCAHHVNSRAARRRDVEEFVDEISFLQAHFGTTQFVVTDSSFLLDRAWVRRMCALILERGLWLRWECIYEVQGRLDPAGVDELFALMHRAGCRKVAFSPETAAPRMIRAIGKHFDPEALRGIHAAARRQGMATMGFFMVGLPDETLEEVDTTIAYALSEPYDRRFFTPLIPLPGTEVYLDLQAREGFERIDWAAYRYERPPWQLGRAPHHLLRQRLIRANLMAHLAETPGPAKLLSRRPWEPAAKYAIRRTLRW